MTDPTTDAATGVPARRSRFLAGVAFFASAWLLAFGLDGTLSTLDDLLGIGGIHVLSAIRNDFALAVVLLLAFPMALLLVFVPHLPKRIFLLPVLYTFWANLIAWPFSVTGGPLASLPLDLLQVAVFGLAIFLVRRRTGRLYLRAADLPVKTHLLRRTLIAFGAVVAALIVAVPVLGAVALAAQVGKQTDGYLRFTSKGVEASEAVLTKGDKTVRLVGMIHIGAGKFYRDLFASFPPQSLVLVEGVSDRQGRLKGKFSYGRIAAALGLDEQSGIQAEWMKSANAAPAGAGASSGAPSSGAPSTGASSSVGGTPVAPGRPTVLRADIDVSDFSDTTVKFLGEVGNIYASPSIWEAFRRISAMDDRYTDKDVAAIYGELIGKRNAQVLSVFDKEAPSHDEIVIPWGAEHMPGIEKALRDRGYTVQSRQALDVVRYGEMF